MFRFFFLCIFVFTVPQIKSNGELPADISFLVVDLKYNPQDGVKICEIQHGQGSAFYGETYLEGGKEVMAERIYSFLSQHYNSCWYIDKKLSYELKRGFESYPDWKGFKSLTSMLKNKEFKRSGSKPVKNPNRILDYHGLIVACYQALDLDRLEKYKGHLILNKAFIPYFGKSSYTDKFFTSQLFDSHETLKKLKPQWKLYPKDYSEALVNTILADFSSELIVIKPIRGFQGRGVIILHRDDLDDILQQILINPSSLKKHPDRGYNWWARDYESDFLVEEFIPSEPVHAYHLSDFPFDGTMRVAFFLTYEKNVMNIHFVCCHWKLPPNSLGDDASLNDKHKSFSRSEDYYSPVDAATEDAVKKQLTEGLFLIYDRLLKE